jgi:hypothetical protein
LKVPRSRPSDAQSVKWFSSVTVPEVRWDEWTEMYWLKVAVPTMEGSFTRSFS